MNRIVPYRKRRRLSVTVLVVCCIVGALFGVWRSARQQRQQALDVFYSDTDIAYDLEVRRQMAYNMLTVAESYPQIPMTLTDEVLRIREEMKDETDISDLYEENDALTAACYKLESALRDLPLTDRDAKSLDGIAAQMESCSLTMARSSYNELARRFNSRVMNSPGVGILVRLMGIRKLELFA